MQVKYTLRTDIVTDEENQKYTVFGITALDSFGNILETFEDIFFSKQKAEEFVELCNQEKLELIHLQNVVEDIL
ncbi:MAG: hypothetical protein IJZ75_00450 [Clostridia bacterium]|nr:hypothetical protein [Clostridia bacterium]